MPTLRCTCIRELAWTHTERDIVAQVPHLGDLDVADQRNRWTSV
jgi:hypothetical protein